MRSLGVVKFTEAESRMELPGAGGEGNIVPISQDKKLWRCRVMMVSPPVTILNVSKQHTSK